MRFPKKAFETVIKFCFSHKNKDCKGCPLFDYNAEENKMNCIKSIPAWWDIDTIPNAEREAEQEARWEEFLEENRDLWDD